MSNYYYIISGLPDISFDDSKAALSLDQFRTEVYEALSSADRKVMDLLILENECRNLIGSERIEELIASVKAQEPCPEGVPQFMYQFVQEWVDESWREKAAFAEDRLWSLFYEYAMHSSNEFVRKWYEFNLDINNILSAVMARKYGLDIQKVIVGANDAAHALRTSGARDWGLSQELEYFEDVVRLTDESDLAQRERKADMLRWRWLEENTFFNYFTVEKLFSYMVRLGMVERWTSMDREKGQKLFREMIGTLKDQTEVPAEFR
ncbi:MAG: DUF2764 domain-containing protein [Bacteroidaceae bacterium]|nr:DUF2764 domain-containing protein [Bacteroidaceae bacterium]